MRVMEVRVESPGWIATFERVVHARLEAVDGARGFQPGHQAALVRVVPDREADEGPGPDVVEEVDAFATEYAELILIGLSKVPRLADGRTPVEVVPDESVEDKADREWLGFTHNGSYAARTRHVLVKRERDRRRSARELAVAYVPLAFRLAFAVVVLIGFAGFAWGTATNFVVFLPDTMALAVSVALNLWALYSMLNYTAAFLEVDADALSCTYSTYAQ